MRERERERERERGEGKREGGERERERERERDTHTQKEKAIYTPSWRWTDLSGPQVVEMFAVRPRYPLFSKGLEVCASRCFRSSALELLLVDT